MAYLSKETLLAAYKTLSTLSENPSAQGATQKVSAIRYVLALNMFYKKNNRECDTRDSKDKAEFIEYVNRIVALNDVLYTTNFYTSLAMHQGDCAVGSNFYSVNAVKNSLTNPSITIDYPQRGGNPLFSIKGGKLFENESYKRNLNVFLPRNSYKFALILWILRKENLDFSSLYQSLKLQMQRFFTSSILEYLLPTEEYFNEFCSSFEIKYQSSVAKIEQEDIYALFEDSQVMSFDNITMNKKYISYLAALRTKPFMLLAGISGTGKSRIAREIAKACWETENPNRTAQVPENFCMIQVKPNWHDSTELLGYVSRISEDPHYVTGDFLPFIAKAWENPDVPYILCLDEMNLAPVEQYFAEYLSVIESRKAHEDGTITTDPLLKPIAVQWYYDLVQQITRDDRTATQFKKEGIAIPQNLFVIGTVNMDETTFSFSRKVLDRAMTIEMNEVDLYGGLDETDSNELGYIGKSIIGNTAEGKDVYAKFKDLCRKVLKYLEDVNKVLDGTPFKIAYRTRNEFLLYAVNRKQLAPYSEVWQTLDEMTSMKILSRIEGDADRCKKPLEQLQSLLQGQFTEEQQADSISLKKIKEMLGKLNSGYTSYWT